jgi:hypothetical protein
MYIRNNLRVALSLALIAFSVSVFCQNGAMVSTNQNQKKLISSYRFILENSDNDYRTNEVTDKQLFPAYGESSIYRVLTGSNKGSFIYADALPDNFSNLTHSTYTNYNWQAQPHLSIQFKKHPKRIAIFKSAYKTDGTNLSWESIYFERLFSEFLMDGITYTIDEETLASEGLDSNTELLIIPSFVVNDTNYTYYIDSIFSIVSGMKDKIDLFLSKGGNIYAEGNACYFIEKLGYLEDGAISYENSYPGGLIDISVNYPTEILALAADAALNKLYGSDFPSVNSSRITKIASGPENVACLFRVRSNFTSGGRIHCNTGLPTVNGLSDPGAESQQISWTLNSIFDAFSSPVDVTRKVNNELVYAGQLGDNSISYDCIDTFDVDLRIRNLSNDNITISVNEKIKPYFNYVDVTSGPAPAVSGNVLTFSGLTVSAHSELVITYRLVTPEPDNGIHEHVDDYLDRGTLISVGNSKTSYMNGGFNYNFTKDKGFADLLFSARIFADTDVNWKNFLGLRYQPFKVFMIMENKSRSAAENTQYVQYIPKDVPFYGIDWGLNIPILKTPGGKFVDVLKGSNNEGLPEYDMDSDGDPDVWLDTTSIYPKGYTIVEEEVYWANPWNHLRTGSDTLVFEDIDHDGIVPTDTDGDGIVDLNFDEDDKIRVYKVTWDIGQVAGYEYYDPYCSYEIWVDPPNLTSFSAGVGYVYDSIDAPYPGMFYPYTSTIGDADIVNDTAWRNWMERDNDGDIIWKQLIHQRINNYEGFTFVDTSTYYITPYDSLIGTAPQPINEFIAVLSLGGEEIDMRNYTPHNSLYSNVNYETVFGEEKKTPIRTTYSYWAPLPNPLQFEYLSNNYQITDTLGNIVQELPEYGKAHLTFDMDASTEYTYYWIRNVGYDVDYNDASETLDANADLGDGVFGYFVYSIPKGMGGYRITLPRKDDGSYDLDAIVQIDGAPFEKWIDNINTWNEVEIWETPFEYQVYIPQLLIPPALDDDNHDGIDDWIDDRGDRFCSKTGFLHDEFMTGDGEDYLMYPTVPFKDDIYGMVDSGWYAGSDGTYGDDFFEALGKTHITIHADYEGRGREGTVELSKGGVLVCEEIFGGSPWVIFSHVLSGFAKGTDISLESKVIPEVVYYGVDTVYLKHVIKDTNEPHVFDANFDPYHLSYGYGESTITTFVGAKDPCSLIEPAISMPAIVDPDFDNYTITLIPGAAEVPDKTDLSGYPKEVTGSFIEVRVEVGNSTEDNWINTCVKPQLTADIGSVELSYVAYPRPLVPSFVSGDQIIPGDQPGTFTTGWRFNQPEGEVLIKLGDTLNLLQPTRKAYFVFLIKINPALQNGIYEIPFTMNGQRKYYDGTNNGAITFEVPKALFSVVDKDASGQVSAFQKMILDNVSLADLDISSTGNFSSTGVVKYDNKDFEPSEFNDITGELTSSEGGLDLSSITTFPSKDTSVVVIMQQGVVDSYNTDAEILSLTNGQELSYNHASLGEKNVQSEPLVVIPIGPRVKITNTVYSINGIPVEDTVSFESDEDLYVVTLLSVKNTGTDISSNTEIRINPGPYYTILADSLDSNCSISDGDLVVQLGDIIPGELKMQYLPFILDVEGLPKEIDIRKIIDLSMINYEGTLVDAEFSFEDPKDLLLDIYDFEAISISFEENGNSQVQVHASAFNRGINGQNVWFRIYPIIGGGVNEFAFAEQKLEDFLPGETVELTGVYTLPNTDKSIDFIAIIDDGKQFAEILEMNNSIQIAYQVTGLENNETSTSKLEVFPVPFKDVVTFRYDMIEEYSTVSLSIYNSNGRLVYKLDNCPHQQGQNMINWRNSELPDGNYIYQLQGKSMNGRVEQLFSGQIIKSSK